MISKPAIPVLVLLPEDAHTDYKTLFSIATAYAHSGLLVSDTRGDGLQPLEVARPRFKCFWLRRQRAKFNDKGFLPPGHQREGDD